MKKYILMLAVAAATALVACGNKEAQAEEAPATDTIEAVETEIVETVDTNTEAPADTNAVAETPAE